MDANEQQPEPAEIDAPTRLRIVSVELNEATAELYKARHDVLYRRLRVLPARWHMPAWTAALLVGSIGAAVGAVPTMMIRGENLWFVFVAVMASYTILSPATLLLLRDEEVESDENRLKSREESLRLALEHREKLRQRVTALQAQLDRAKGQAVGGVDSQSE